ncbi:hypothetical protein [Fluviicola chungangensis]|uniref:Uncharacterized protein n=1 Tax=Fluviicola chungangensis TaxID=2597671 RepID=A0A556MPI3_9FLAO|nr:hypothetical protein [Fluviicola chungangensis]TSJ41629.1 hypothetical protein FO442_14305 [Fluviicola chungangensis]
MHKLIFPFIFLVLPFWGSGQQIWKELWHLELDSTAIWDIDPIHQSIIYQNQNIQKRDAKGQIMLQESIKSLGNIQKIDAQNPLKIALFSEDQQSICFLDNALALQGDCIYLSDLDISLAVSMSASIQTDRIWVYDEPNSKIELITLRNGQGQQVQNVKGLLNMKSIVNIQEIDNRLYLFDEENQVAWFDQFGNFIDVATLPPHKPVYPIQDYFLISEGKNIQTVTIDSEFVSFFFAGDLLLDSKILKMEVSGDRLYIQTLKMLYCFKILQ